MALNSTKSLQLSTIFMVSFLLFLIISPFDVTKAQPHQSTPLPPIANGLSWSFYQFICPQLELIVREQLRMVFSQDIGQAAGLLRLHFHDCFVQGCDGSLLLDEAEGRPSEKQAIPNLTLRARAFEIIDDVQSRVHSVCGPVVSCSDLVALAARDAVFFTGGPQYNIPLGRRDSLEFASQSDTLANLPPSSANTTTLLASLAAKNFDAIDVVALSGAHTIGVAHCRSFTDRLYPNQDPTMDGTFASNLRSVCPDPSSNNTTPMDIRSPNWFDNRYYVDLVNRQGLFTSDQDLFTDARTRGIVVSFAANQWLFFQRFVVAMLKMGQLNVLTGSSGEIRANCKVRNYGNSLRSSSVSEDDQVMTGFSQF